MADVNEMPEAVPGGTSSLFCTLDDFDSLPIHSIHHWDASCLLGDYKCSSVWELLLRNSDFKKMMGSLGESL